MATIARLGYGSTVTFSTYVAEIKSISISSEKEDIDVTHMQSPDLRREFIGGLLDPGELTLEVNFDPTQPDPMTLGDDQLVVTWPDSSTWTWPSASANGYDVSAEVGDAMTATVTFKLSSSLAQA